MVAVYHESDDKRYSLMNCARHRIWVIYALVLRSARRLLHFDRHTLDNLFTPCGRSVKMRCLFCKTEQRVVTLRQGDAGMSR